MLHRWRGVVVASLAAVSLGSAGAALAFQGLPGSGQVNEDVAAGINPSLSVSGEDPANADVSGGSLTAGGSEVPWALFRQQEAAGAKDQIFARSFAAGAWSTRGSGTVGGRSSASPVFPGSLNFDQAQDGEAPSIDFAGAGRTVPWASFYENTTGASFNSDNVFAARFDNTGDANQGKWIFGGQDRGLGGGAVPVPSLNIRTEQKADDPSVAGGSTSDPTRPEPWVTWRETTSSPAGGVEIFTERALGPGMANCDGVTPAGTEVAGHVISIGGFCWQQTGTPRVGPGAADPSLNVDPTREALEPDIAFTGSTDATPWVVWSETGTSKLASPLNSNGMVFAAKAIADGAAPDGGFHWVAVGSAGNGTLDLSGATNHFGSCAESTTAEEACSLNAGTKQNAENPRVAAGTMVPGTPTAPWVVWDENVAGVDQIFVSRLVGGTHFELANGGAPVSTGTLDATRPDITFSGNTPYITWRQDVGGGVDHELSGHFVNGANPTFVKDEGESPLTSSAQADVREPISSACTANPFNGDGSACQGGALGTPFFLFTNGTSPLGLFAGAYQPGVPVTGGASATPRAASVSATVDPAGASAEVFFEYGPTTGYGQSTPLTGTAPGDGPTAFSATIAGLSPGTTIHYRAVARTDFGSVAGSDQVLLTPAEAHSSPAPTANGTAVAGRVKVSGSIATLRLSCRGAAGATCRLTARLSVVEILAGHRLVGLTARTRRHRRTVILGSVTLTLMAGQSRTIHVPLNQTGKRLLKSRRHIKVRLTVLQAVRAGKPEKVSSQLALLKAPRHRR
jgi:hypothetical protein